MRRYVAKRVECEPILSRIIDQSGFGAQLEYVECSEKLLLTWLAKWTVDEFTLESLKEKICSGGFAVGRGSIIQSRDKGIVCCFSRVS